MDTRFGDLIDSIQTNLNYYHVLNTSNWKKKNVRSLEILAFSRTEDKEALKNIFSSIFVNDFGITPYEVSCKDKKDYSLIQEVLREKGINKSLSHGILEYLMNMRLIF
ncbi:hypothetical protein GW931_01100 [archaeon]|nr:hypothetical protein [archaeon]